MNKKLYEQMDWPRIEAVVYSEESMPYDILGPHIIKQGVLIQTFIPNAARIVIKDLENKKEYPMELADEEGFYGVLLPKKKKIPNYVMVIEKDDGKIFEQKDPYCFKLPFSEEDFQEYEVGIDEYIYQKLGAHLIDINGVKGTVFSVWAPNAVRVSVIGDFNQWDGRVHQMQRLGNTGVFELFIPDVKVDSYYKFEVKKQGNNISIKTDPYGFKTENDIEVSSVVTSLDPFKWTDEKWIQSRKNRDRFESPLSIFEVRLESWVSLYDETEISNYKSLGKTISAYAKEMGYTHVLCQPIMEIDENSYEKDNIIAYYAPSSKYGSPSDFMDFVNEMHVNEIGLILDWVPSFFSREYFGLGEFDGTCLYEHQDLRQRFHGENGNPVFRYGCSQVQNFLLANALFWFDKFHIDGLRVRSLASMLYLDYYKRDGQWLPNIYGGNENLETVEFLKLLNSTIKKRNNGIIMIAEDASLWPGVTESVENQGLGFDFKQNIGWSKDFFEYMACDPFYRSDLYGQLTLSMVYAYCEKYLLSLPGNISLQNLMPGDSERQLANLRLALGFMIVHPGRKMLTLGEESSIIHHYVKTILDFYHQEPALFQFEDTTDGFEWINNISANESMLVFLRKAKEEKDNLLVVCNFSSDAYSKYKLGVPSNGNYKEIFNSDAEIFGGIDIVNRDILESVQEECDGRENSICIKVPPLSIIILKKYDK